jgi:hypothetical protein
MVDRAKTSRGKPDDSETVMSGLGRGVRKHAYRNVGRCALLLLHVRLEAHNSIIRTAHKGGDETSQ